MPQAAVSIAASNRRCQRRFEDGDMFDSKSYSGIRA
jgi:hypothetical protein